MSGDQSLRVDRVLYIEMARRIDSLSVEYGVSRGEIVDALYCMTRAGMSREEAALSVRDVLRKINGCT